MDQTLIICGMCRMEGTFQSKIYDLFQITDRPLFGVVRRIFLVRGNFILESRGTIPCVGCCKETCRDKRVIQRSIEGSLHLYMAQGYRAAEIMYPVTYNQVQ
jgi:hypothetical protein